MVFEDLHYITFVDPATPAIRVDSELASELLYVIFED